MNPADARAVDVRPGATVTGIDVAVARIRGADLEGRVIDGTTGGSYDDNNGPVVCSGIPGAGKFSPPGRNSGLILFPGIEPGHIVIRCLTSRLGGSASIDIQEADVDNIRVVLQPLITVPGHLRVDAGAAAPAAADLSKIRVMLSPIEQTTPIQTDGAFATPGAMAGDYRLTLTGLPAHAYLKAARFGDTDLLTDHLHLDAEVRNTVDLLVSFNPGAVRAVVVDEKDRPLPGALVAVVPYPEQPRRFDLYRSAIADSGGHVHLDGLAPGDYKILAWEDLDENAWHEPDILRPYEDRGIALHIREGITEDVKLTALR